MPSHAFVNLPGKAFYIRGFPFSSWIKTTRQSPSKRLVFNTCSWPEFRWFTASRLWVTTANQWPQNWHISNSSCWVEMPTTYIIGHRLAHCFWRRKQGDCYTTWENVWSSWGYVSTCIEHSSKPICIFRCERHLLWWLPNPIGAFDPCWRWW